MTAAVKGFAGLLILISGGKEVLGGVLFHVKAVP